VQVTFLSSHSQAAFPNLRKNRAAADIQIPALPDDQKMLRLSGDGLGNLDQFCMKMMSVLTQTNRSRCQIPAPTGTSN